MRRRPSKRRLKSALLNADCSFILKRRRSSTARMMIDVETQRTNHSTSSVIVSEPEDRRIVLESSSSISARVLATLRRKQFERKFAGGSCVVVLIGGSTIWHVCLTPSFEAGLRTTVATTNQHFTLHYAIWTNAWRIGRWRNTNA